MIAFEKLRQDVFYGVIVYRRRPVPCLLAVASLGLGIGVGTAIFSIVNAILLQPLPYRDPGRLVMVWSVNEKEGFTEDQMRSQARSMSEAEFLDWQEKSGVFEGMIAFGPAQGTVTGRGDAFTIFGYSPTPGLFQLLGIKPMIGREFLPEEERSGNTNILILRYDLWRRRFAGDPAVLGQKVQFSDAVYSIVGVMPPQFIFFSRQAEFLSPMEWNSEEMRQYRSDRWLRVMARLKPGDSLKQAQARADVVGVVGDVREDGIAKPPQPAFYAPLEQRPTESFFLAIRAQADPLSVMPAVRQALTEVDPRISIYRLRKLNDIVLDSTWRLRYSMLLLCALAGLSLILAVIGVYGVLSYAVTVKTPEIGVRMALGASQHDIVRLIARRGLALVAIGALLGLVAACALTRFLSSLLFGISPLDPLTFPLVMLVLIIIGWLACYLPALRASRINPMTALRYE